MTISSKEDINRIILEDAWMMDVLRAAQKLELPDWWVCAGFVRSKIWDELHQFGERTPLQDVDVIYFDTKNVKEETEKRLEAELRSILPDVPWSVKNQARMHKVNNLPPYVSSEDGIASFPETVTALGVSLSDEGKLLLTAPHGVEDVLNMQVKPSPLFSGDSRLEAIYHKRIREKDWSAVWNKVRYT